MHSKTMHRMQNIHKNGWSLNSENQNILLGNAFCFVVFIILLFKFHSVASSSILGISYSIFIIAYIFGRFGIAGLYKPLPRNNSFTPSVSVVIPAFNEEETIFRNIELWLQQSYPNFEVIVVNDGSTDKTLAALQSLKSKYSDEKLAVISYEKNSGKRFAQKLGFERSKNDIIVIADSDSFPAHPESIMEIVQQFQDPEVGGVSGCTDIANPVNWLSKSQKTRYFIAFNRYKRCEAVSGSVICLSGCFSAIRRTALLQILDTWYNQTFLGNRTTYGDDRALTTYLLKNNWKTVYAPTAKAQTYVPTNFKKFWKQQLRWQKSFIRETIVGGKFIWKKPRTALHFYLGAAVTFASFGIALYTIWLLPIITKGSFLPMLYTVGITLISTLYIVDYRMHFNDNFWIYAPVYALMSASVLIWRMPFAIAAINDGKWGTRGNKIK